MDVLVLSSDAISPINYTANANIRVFASSNPSLFSLSSPREGTLLINTCPIGCHLIHDAISSRFTICGNSNTGAWVSTITIIGLIIVFFGDRSLEDNVSCEFPSPKLPSSSYLQYTSDNLASGILGIVSTDLCRSCLPPVD
jgi:hypothetical protein